MWFYPLLAALLLLGLAGVIFLGGVYTLVLVPLMVIVFGSLLVYGMWARANARPGDAADASEGAGQRPLPHRPQRASGPEPVSPERLVEGRRTQQQVSES